MLQLKDNLISNNNYGTIAKFLHWIIALLIIINYILGLTLESNKCYFIHKQIGLTILFLALVRVFWRICTPYPSLLKELSVFEKITAKLGHLFLYLLIIIIPLSGIILIEHFGYPLHFWGLFLIPVVNFQMNNVLNNIVEIHLYLAHLIIVIAVLHTVFALKHHFFNKDRTLLRMLVK